jgi:hypothetical protein
MRRLEGPGSETRLRSIQARFRALRWGAERRNALHSARPLASEFLLFFAAFVVVGALVWWLVA